MENDHVLPPNLLGKFHSFYFYFIETFSELQEAKFFLQTQTQDHSWVNPPSWREARLPLILEAFYWIFCHREDFYRNLLNLGEGMIRSVSGESGEEFPNDRDGWMLSW